MRVFELRVVARGGGGVVGTGAAGRAIVALGGDTRVLCRSLTHGALDVPHMAQVAAYKLITDLELVREGTPSVVVPMKSVSDPGHKISSAHLSMHDLARAHATLTPVISGVAGVRGEAQGEDIAVASPGASLHEEHVVHGNGDGDGRGEGVGVGLGTIAGTTAAETTGTLRSTATAVANSPDHTHAADGGSACPPLRVPRLLALPRPGPRPSSSAKGRLTRAHAR